MPYKTIYIRNSDLEKWDKLEKKSQKVSNLLNGASDSYAPGPKAQNGTSFPYDWKVERGTVWVQDPRNEMWRNTTIRVGEDDA